MWNTGELAQASGVTSRTLRHYDRIGLLHPARTDASGLRWYGQEELVRLQRILVLRELGLPLADIRQVVDGDTDHLSALRRHARQLRAHMARTAAMVGAVERTVSALERNSPMDAERMFDGFGDDPYADEARERWPEQYAESQSRIAGLTGRQQRDLIAEGNVISQQLAAIMPGAEPADPDVQELVGRHYAWVANFWTPDREAYIGLGRMYVSDERFRAHYDGFVLGLPEFLRDGIEIWAEANLPPGISR